MSVTQSACARSHAGRPMAGKDAHGKGRDATGLKDGRRHLGKGAAVVVPCTERRPQALDLSATVDRGASLAVVVINYDKEIQRVAAIVGSAVPAKKVATATLRSKRSGSSAGGPPTSERGWTTRPWRGRSGALRGWRARPARSIASPTLTRPSWRRSQGSTRHIQK
ncbi:hypothetical protein TW95_gp1765 [Pandoravirus inopinatum]|uniref:Uncharacterized protein n=1 Tax=Pandoravirus inopinatum TaxID=1605721 RepID=A0A0B5J4D2_9VIRU|nr:hypothetical protein TW95_gp1765 [Pandoravirus inopinatum]AJF98499.1 hypothetical protein [Pandoravirus inopinatum]